MISWILSKLFSVKTLTSAINMKKDIVAVSVTSAQEVEDMFEMFQDMIPAKHDGRLEHVH